MSPPPGTSSASSASVIAAAALVALGVYGLLEYVGSRGLTSHARESTTTSAFMFDIGSSLREARLRQDLDFPELEERTKIRPKYLRALEDERFDILPAPTYVRGFLRSYAEALGLDGQPFVDEYNSRFTVGRGRRAAARASRAAPRGATAAHASRASRRSPSSRSRSRRRSSSRPGSSAARRVNLPGPATGRARALPLAPRAGDARTSSSARPAATRGWRCG